MPNYIQIEFKNISSDQSDLLIAELTMISFEGFEEEDNLLKAFIPANDFDEMAVDEIASKNNVSFTQSTIEETNWNAVWESNFQPVVIDDFVSRTPWVGIRANFHKPITGVEHEIIITPKMSFGTGHHATTVMMIQQMQEIDFTNKIVFDFGTGTGILAILAERLGASKIIAVDNDDWSIANTKENLERNSCTKVDLKKEGSAMGNARYDIILANINNNVIVENFSVFVQQLSNDGVLLLSGLLAEDEKDILEEAGKFPLSMRKIITNNNWISLRFNR
jgi:ribosomal protein L11 methyltransferase